MRKDPLERGNLDFRRVLIEAVTLPSMVAQSDRNFKWIILIEPDLPEPDKLFLRNLVSPYDHFYLHTLDEHDFLGYHDWLDQYINAGSDYLITTHLDDDDALPTDFVSTIRTHVANALDKTPSPALVLGTTNVIQWDMDFNKDFPYGTYSKWHREKFLTVSCGFTFVARYPDIRLYILSLLHSRMRAYFNKHAEVDLDHPGVIWVRGQLREMYTKMGLQADSIFDIPFHDLSDSLNAVLMTNHGRNLQARRVYEAKDDYVPVVYGQPFGLCPVRWQVIDENRAYFEKIPPLRRWVDAPFLKRQYLIAKYAIRRLILGKDADPSDPMRPRTLAEFEQLKEKTEHKRS